MDNPVLSIIVPVYNLAPYIDECLESLAGQTYSHLEIICVDDGSTDESAEKLRTWAQRDKRIRIVSKPNGGVSSARNAGLRQATGEYVAFVDGDDYLDQDTARAVLRTATACNADIVVFGGRAFPETQWVTEVFGPRDTVRTDDGRAIIFEERGCIPSASNKVYRRALLAEHGLFFNEDLVLGEDTAFQFLAFPLASCVAFLSSRFYHYRFEREGSAVTEHFKHRLFQLTEHVKELDYISREWKKAGYLAGCETQLLSCISFIFNDFYSMTPNEQQVFARRFAQVFERYFSRDNLDAMEREIRYRYELFLSLASDDLSLRGAKRLLAVHTLKLRILHTYRSIRK